MDKIRDLLDGKCCASYVTERLGFIRSFEPKPEGKPTVFGRGLNLNRVPGFEQENFAV